MIQHTASGHAPWYVVPADHKWFTRLVVAGAIIDTLENLDLQYPKVDEHKREELRLVQAELERDGGGSKKAADAAPQTKKRKVRRKAATRKVATTAAARSAAANEAPAQSRVAGLAAVPAGDAGVAETDPQV
jgi:hypothetical protein